MSVILTGTSGALTAGAVVGADGAAVGAATTAAAEAPVVGVGAAGALVGAAGACAAQAAANSPLAPAPSTLRNSRRVVIRMPPPVQPGCQTAARSYTRLPQHDGSAYARSVTARRRASRQRAAHPRLHRHAN